MIDFYLGKNHLELVGAICAAVLVVFPLLKLSICGVRKQAENTAAKMAAFPVNDGAGRSISLAGFPVGDAAGRTPVATAIAARSAWGIPISLAAFSRDPR